MAKLEKVSPEQEDLMIKVRDEWIKRALLDGDEIDDKSARESIEWMYQKSDLKKPITIIVDSPLAIQYAIPIAKELIKNGGSYGQVRDQVYDQVSGQVSGQVYGQVRDQVRDQVSGQVYGQVYGQVSGQVSGQVYDQVYDQVYGQVRDQVYDQKLSYESFSYDGLSWDAGWASFIDFFDRLGLIKNSDWKKYVRFLKSGIFMGVYLDGLAVVCRRPSAVRRDNQNRLDNDQKPAIEWRDGYKLWYLHGVNFEESEWQKIVNQEMTLEDLAKASMGADKSAVAIQMLRPDLLLKHCNAKLIHTGIKGTRLYEVKNFMDTGTTQYCMRMKHPTIDREYIEWVHPDIGKQGNADLAQASAWVDKDGDHIPVEDYLLALSA